MHADRRGAEERRLAIGIATILGVLALPAAVVAYLAVGPTGVVSVLVGIALVGLLFGGSAALLAWTVARSPGAAPAALVGGLVVRLPLYAASLVLFDRLSWTHGRTLAFTVVVAVVVTLVYELRAIARSPRMFWTSPVPEGVPAATNATRSQLL